MMKFGVAAKAIIYNTKTKKYLLVKKSKVEDINPDTYDMPGGRVEFGEEPIKTVVREVKEETGLDVTPQQPFNTWTFTDKEKDFQLVGIDFLCFTKRGEVELSEEHCSYEWRKAEAIIGDSKYPDWLRQTIEKVEEVSS